MRKRNTRSSSSSEGSSKQAKKPAAAKKSSPTEVARKITQRCDLVQELVSVTSGWFDNPTHSDLEVRLRGAGEGQGAGDGGEEQQQVVRCHKLMLSSWSDVWAAALEDKSQDVLELTAFDADTTRLCLQYCYTGDIAFLTDTNLVDVHRFALCYHLQGLQSFCETVMQEQLSQKNCLSVYAYLADIPSLPAAFEAAKNSVCQHFTTVAKEDSFCELSTHALCELLKSDELGGINEDQVLKACCHWATNKRPAVSLQSQESVLQYVRFSQLSPKALLEFKSHELMKQSQAVVGLYQLGLEWRMTEQTNDNDDRKAMQQQLMKANKIVKFTPRRRRLQIESKILDDSMIHQLGSMFGRSVVAKKLLQSEPGKIDTRPTQPILCVIKDGEGYVFGCYCDTLVTPQQWGVVFVPVEPNKNFLFSLKEIGDQKVVKLDMTRGAIFLGPASVNISGGLEVFSQVTDDEPLFQLAAGYEGRPRTLHGEFGEFEASETEIFSVEPRVS